MNIVDLVIPTYNRPKFLKRILEYYDSSPIKFNIIVVDSSLPKYKKQNKKTISLYPNLNISYFDNFSPKQPSHFKYAQMLKYVKAKYCVFCADDDFIIPNGIKEAVDFLEKNPDYSCAHGSYISFYLYKNIFGYAQFWWRSIYPYTSIKSSNPLTRLSNHFENYYQVLWAVRKTSVVKRSYQEFLKSKISPYFFGELLPDMLTLIFGKMKHLDNFYCARQAFSTSYGYWPSLIDAKQSKIYDQEYNKFRNCLVKNLAKFGFSKNHSSNIIDLDMKMYLKTTMQEHLTGRVNLVLKYFPSFLEKFLRLVHVIYLFSKTKSEKIGPVNNQSSKYFDDFDKIRQIVMKYEY